MQFSGNIISKYYQHKKFETEKRKYTQNNNKWCTQDDISFTIIKTRKIWKTVEPEDEHPRLKC